MSKSTTRGRQRGRRRNRPLRCEASTRMREWMCYRNHLVRRRGSAHGTSGRCPFHITKFSPGRSCWARESYSCPEYLMEKDFSLGWWNAVASAWFPASAILKIIHCGSNFALVYAIVHEKPRMNIRETWHNWPWQYFRSFDHGIVILSVFMAPDRVVLPASRNKSHRKLLTCFLGAGGPWLVISRTQA